MSSDYDLLWGALCCLLAAAVVWVFNRARRRRLRSPGMLYLTGTVQGGTVEDIVRTVFCCAQIALFDGGSGTAGTGRQVTEWQPYDVDGGTGVICPGYVFDPWVEVRSSHGDSTSRWPVTGPVKPGHLVRAPRPVDWFGPGDPIRWQ